MIIIFAILLLLFSSPVLAANYWVHPSGTAANWAACQSATDPGGGSPYSNYCSRGVMNSQTGAGAGDTVYLKGGTYLVENGDRGINPSKETGTSGAKIIYQPATGETVIFQLVSGSAQGIWLGDNPWVAFPANYIKVTGTATNKIQFINLGVTITKSSSYNEIAYCTITNGGIAIVGNCSGGECGCKHNWIHHNEILDTGGGGSCTAPAQELGDSIVIGSGDNGTCSGGDKYSDNNTVEDNIITHGGHGTVNSYGLKLVFRNNIIRNEPWKIASAYAGYPGDCIYPASFTNDAWDGYYGHRNAQFTDDYLRDGIFNLIENNRIGYNSVNPNNGGDGDLVIAGSKNIVRYNSSYGGTGVGVYFKYANALTCSVGGYGGINNRVYNNTLYKAGYGYDGSPALNSRGGFLIALYSGSDSLNIVKNNIVYDTSPSDFVASGSYCTGGFQSCVTTSNNWCTSAATGCTGTGDPKFTNTSLLDVTSTTLPNLNLQSSSTAINGGTYLTQANGAGTNSTVLVVDDAMYFQDGTWGSDLVRTNGTMVADQIAVGTVSSTVAISSINYATNTITLASPMTWADNAPVWLYKNSSGVQVLYGSAPDYGAFEYQITEAQNPRLLGGTIQGGVIR